MEKSKPSKVHRHWRVDLSRPGWCPLADPRLFSIADCVLLPDDVSDSYAFFLGRGAILVDSCGNYTYRQTCRGAVYSWPVADVDRAIQLLLDDSVEDTPIDLDVVRQKIESAGLTPSCFIDWATTIPEIHSDPG
jgi:hypothetical protein